MTEVNIITLLLLPTIDRETVDFIVKGRFYNWDKRELYNLIKDVYNIPIEFGDFNYAYNKALEITSKNKELGLQTIGFHNPEYPKKFKGNPNAPLVFYASGNLSCLKRIELGCFFGKSSLSDYGILASKRVVRRFYENNIIFVGLITSVLDFITISEYLTHHGKVILIIPGNFELTKYQHYINNVINSNGCVIYMPNLCINNNKHLTDATNFKIALSELIIIVEYDKGKLDELIKNYEKNVYCLRFPKRFLTSGNYELIQRGDALPIDNKEDLLSIINKTKNNYKVYENCFMFCFQFDKIWVKENKIRDPMETDYIELSETVLYVKDVEIKLNSNKQIIKVIDHQNQTIYFPSSDCTVTIKEDKHRVIKASNNMYNCFFEIWKSAYSNNEYRINVTAPTNNKIKEYELDMQLFSKDISIKLNKHHEIVYIFDKINEIHYYLSPRQKVRIIQAADNIKIQEIYFECEYSYIEDGIAIEYAQTYHPDYTIFCDYYSIDIKETSYENITRVTFRRDEYSKIIHYMDRFENVKEDYRDYVLTSAESCSE